MVMIVTAAAVTVLVVMLMVMMLVLMLVVMTAAAMTVLVVMMVRMLQLRDGGCQGSLALDRLGDLSARQLIPGGSDNRSVSVMLSQHGNSRIQLLLRNAVGAGENNGLRRFDLVVIKFAEVLHVDLDLARIHNRNRGAKDHIFIGDLFHGGDHIGQLAHTGGFNDDPVGIILLDDLGERLSEITHQAAANAAGVHFGNVDARILQKAAVNADLAKFVFDQHKLLSAVMLCDHLLDERCLACAKKSGINIDLCHSDAPSVQNFTAYIITPFFQIHKTKRCARCKIRRSGLG